MPYGQSKYKNVSKESQGDRIWTWTFLSYFKMIISLIAFKVALHEKNQLTKKVNMASTLIDICVLTSFKIWEEILALENVLHQSHWQ